MRNGHIDKHRARKTCPTCGLRGVRTPSAEGVYYVCGNGHVVGRKGPRVT